ncbi:MAG: hypothetical protein AB7G06_02970 [Bdellovibrionales bacterium]
MSKPILRPSHYRMAAGGTAAAVIIASALSTTFPYLAEEPPVITAEVITFIEQPPVIPEPQRAQTLRVADPEAPPEEVPLIVSENEGTPLAGDDDTDGPCFVPYDERSSAGASCFYHDESGAYVMMATRPAPRASPTIDAVEP